MEGSGSVDRPPGWCRNCNLLMDYSIYTFLYVPLAVPQMMGLMKLMRVNRRLYVDVRQQAATKTTMVMAMATMMETAMVMVQLVNKQRHEVNEKQSQVFTNSSLKNYDYFYPETVHFTSFMSIPHCISVNLTKISNWFTDALKLVH